MKNVCLTLLFNVALVYSGFGRPMVTNAGNDYQLTIEKGKQIFEGGKFVKIKLLNNTNDTLKYTTMSCSWWQYYRIDNPNIHLDVELGCDKNIPVQLILAPHQTAVLDLKLYADTKDNLALSKFKVGLNIAKYEASLIKFNAYADLDHPKILIWSNTLEWNR